MECPICLERYTGSQGPHLPKVFSCGHSICELCLKEFSSAQLECVLCRATVDAANISTNYALCSVLDAETAQPPSNTARTGSTTARSSSPSPKAGEDDGFFSMTEDSDDDDPLPAGRRWNRKAQASRRTFEERLAPSAPPLETLEHLDPELAPSAPPFAGYSDVAAPSANEPNFQAGSWSGNDLMVAELVESGALRSNACINAFKAVDRKLFWPHPLRTAYAQTPLRLGKIHLSAPHIYGKALESLMPLRPGMSFLNVGSGTGYFSCIVSELIGPVASNHGIEIWPEVFDHAKSCVAAAGKHHLKFTLGNIYDTDTNNFQRYDRIYIGACANSRSKFLYRLLEVDGILVGPFQVGESQELRRVVRQTESEFTVDVLGSVSFAGLVENRDTRMEDEDTLKCPAEHSLESRRADQAYECDVCGVDIQTGDELKYCERCDHAVCQQCSVVLTASSDVFTEVRNVESAPRTQDTLKCPAEHSLESRRADQAYECDVCGVDIQTGDELKYCERCDHAVCQQCSNFMLSVVNPAGPQADELGSCSNLLEAAQRGHEGLVQQFLRADPHSVKSTGRGRRTALHEACDKGHRKVVAQLIGASADVEAVDIVGWTPLHFAARKGDAMLVLMLLAANANCRHAKTDFGATPYDIAKTEGRTHLLNELQVQWTCQVCAKKNPLDTENCTVCGRRKGHILRASASSASGL